MSVNRMVIFATSSKRRFKSCTLDSIKYKQLVTRINCKDLVVVNCGYLEYIVLKKISIPKQLIPMNKGVLRDLILILFVSSNSEVQPVRTPNNAIGINGKTDSTSMFLIEFNKANKKTIRMT